METYIAVTPNLPYTQQESVNLRGYPATHLVSQDNPSKTLCGKNPDTWDVSNEKYVNCKVCLRIKRKKIKK